MPRYPSFKLYQIDEEIEFQINGKEVIGIVEECEIRINRYEKTVIIYLVKYNEDFISVDGNLFQKI